MASVAPFLRWALGRVRTAAWPVAQAAVAGGVAWILAIQLLDHPQPLFAPVAAIASLAEGAGGRGERAIKMLVGLTVGVVVGELLVLLFGVGPLQVTLAAAVAMLTTAFFVFSPLPLIHAGVAAIIVVATQSPESGGGRLLDGLVGGVVALFFSQIFFTPSPVSLLTNAVREVLGPVAGSLRATARALADDDAETAADALRRLRENQDSLSGLADARETSRGGRPPDAPRAARGGPLRTPRRASRGDRPPLRQRLARRQRRATAPRRAHLRAGVAHRAVDELARGVEALADDPESTDARQRTRDLALEAERTAAPGTDHHPSVVVIADQVKLAAADVLRVATPDGPESKSAERPVK